VKTIDLSIRPLSVNTLLEQAREEDLLVRLADGSEFMVVAVDDFDRELAHTRCNEKLLVLLEGRAKQARTVLLHQVKKELGLAD
jgi:hypothetical protein